MLEPPGVTVNFILVWLVFTHSHVPESLKRSDNFCSKDPSAEMYISDAPLVEYHHLLNNKDSLNSVVDEPLSSSFEQEVNKSKIQKSGSIILFFIVSSFS